MSESEKSDASPRATILIIDTDGEKAKALVAALDVLNLDVLIESSAEAGLNRLESLAFAVVLLDVDPHGAGGLETARAIRKSNASKCLSILFTGRQALTDGELSRLFSLRTVDFTRFPVPVEVIRTKVSMLLELCQAYQAAWDLSERRKATDAQKRNEAEIRKSRAKMEIILEGIGDAIFVLDPKGGVEYLNPAAATMLGYGSPKDVYDLANSPEAAVARLAMSLSDEEGNPIPLEKTPTSLALQGVEVPPMLIRYRKDNDAPEKWIISRARPITDENGAIQFVVAIVQDVTDIRNSESELRQSQKMEAIGRLAGGIAHDFNNLLTAINGYSEVGLDMAGEDNPLHPLLKEILDAGTRAAALTNQLLAHSRKQILLPKILDMNGTLRAMQSLLTRIIGEDMDLAMLLHDDGSLIKADPGQVEQVILNLVVNARDAMPTGGKVTLESKVVHIEKGHVDVGEPIPPGRYFRLCVSDTGHGMSKSVRDHIFEPFYTTKPVNKGTGLGLSTVYGIVKQSGGYISVYSEPNFGATFKIYFPLAGDAVNQTLALPREKPSLVSLGETILLVEDEGVVRKLTETILTGMDYRVLAASSGETALDMARRHQGSIDLLLTDVVMSGMGGQDLALELRKSRPGLPVLYMSGYTDDAIVRHGVLESTANFIQKPFSPRILSEKVREALAPAGPLKPAPELQGR